MSSDGSGPDLPRVGRWATEKLDRLGKYLAAYTTILRKMKWCQGYVFVDAFAGAGRAVLRDDGDGDRTQQAIIDLVSEPRDDGEAQQYLDGSPRVALAIEHPFTHYVFVEKDEQRRKALEQLEWDFPNRSILIRDADCNEYLRKSLIEQPRVNWKKWRGVVFLDPFGMQVPWSTIEGLANTGAIEVIINFPVGMAIQRLLKTSGEFTEKERAKLDEYFGDPGWYELLYTEGQPDLFGQTQIEKAERSGDLLVNWYTERLKNAFGHVSPPYLVRNTKNAHLYYLVWAGPNATGKKIASHVLGGGESRAQES